MFVSDLSMWKLSLWDKKISVSDRTHPVTHNNDWNRILLNFTFICHEIVARERESRLRRSSSSSRVCWRTQRRGTKSKRRHPKGSKQVGCCSSQRGAQVLLWSSSHPPVPRPGLTWLQHMLQQSRMHPSPTLTRSPPLLTFPPWNTSPFPSLSSLAILIHWYSRHAKAYG